MRKECLSKMYDECKQSYIKYNKEKSYQGGNKATIPQWILNGLGNVITCHVMNILIIYIFMYIYYFICICISSYRIYLSFSAHESAMTILPIIQSPSIVGYR